MPRAKTADRYDLYTRSVQAADVEVRFFRRTFKTLIGRKARVLREDFCGTGWVCAEWVKKKGRTAYGVDLDPEPLAWGRAHHLNELTGEQRSRVQLLEANVLNADVPLADVIAAQNFSFYYFHDRKQLLHYFRTAYASLQKGGLFFLDMLGGPACEEQNEYEEKRVEHPEGDFTYCWEQALFEPIHRRSVYYIHFKFDDGSKMKKAFTYDWRMWTIPEVRDILEEAGFKTSHVFWEGTDKDGEGDGVFSKAETADPDLGWVSYVIGEK